MRSAIERGAQEEGISPAYALAVAERESNFDPSAKASKTIFGMYQMTGPVRQQYGHGNTLDPYEQTKAFARYTKGLQADMGHRLGREATYPEIYTSHHFGPGRAASMLKGENTSVADVFTPYELSLNPHIVRAGTTGALRDSTVGDMTRRMGKYGGQDSGAPQPTGGPSEPFSFAQYGESVDEGTEPAAASPRRESPAPPSAPPLPARERSQPTMSPAPNFAAYGKLVEEKADEAPVTAPPAQAAPPPQAAPQQVAEAPPQTPPPPEPPQAAPPQQVAAAAPEADEAPSLDLSAHTKWRRAQEV